MPQGEPGPFSVLPVREIQMRLVDSTIGSTGSVKIRRLRSPSRNPRSSTRSKLRISNSGSLRMESLLLSKRLRATCELSSKARRGGQTGTTRVRAYSVIGNVRPTSRTSFFVSKCDELRVPRVVGKRRRSMSSSTANGPRPPRTIPNAAKTRAARSLLSL
jgi:hypothetical protein